MKAILWDMDGTVLDSEPAHEAAFHDAALEIGLVLPEGFHDGLLGCSGDQVHAAMVRAGLGLSFDDWTALKAGHYARHGAVIARREPSASVAVALAREGVPMALVSNSTVEEVEMNLRVTGMADLFGVTVSRGDVVQGKPAPEGYLLAASRLGIAPERCMVVEDSQTGARAGLAAGMAVLQHPQGPQERVPGALWLDPDASPEDVIRRFLSGA